MVERVLQPQNLKSLNNKTEKNFSFILKAKQV